MYSSFVNDITKFLEFTFVHICSFCNNLFLQLGSELATQLVHQRWARASFVLRYRFLHFFQEVFRALFSRNNNTKVWLAIPLFANKRATAHLYCFVHFLFVCSPCIYLMLRVGSERIAPHCCCCPCRCTCTDIIRSSQVQQKYLHKH